MGTFDLYLHDILPNDREADKVAKEFYKSFMEQFPKDKITQMPLDKYLFAPYGYGHDNSFCRQLMYSPLASLGNSFPSIFGIYLKGGKELKLSKTYAELCGGDATKAFEMIKHDIVNLLESSRKMDFDAIEKCNLNSTFKNILIATYCPDLFLPAPTTTAMNAYSEALCYSFADDLPMAYKNYKLVEWMKSVPECQTWDSFILMRFCDWLWRSGKKVNAGELTQYGMGKQSKDILDELEKEGLSGEYNEAITKVRINQGEFRERLIRRYNKCVLCGVSNVQLLTASHIKPWALSEAQERLDVNNGFLMCPNHDRLFDRGFISFDDDGRILISEELQKNDRIFMNVNENMKVELTTDNRKYLNYHRMHIFK